MADKSFKHLYDQECHVCTKTMRIGEKLVERNMPIEFLAEDLAYSVDDIQSLLDAEYCDPQLVQRLCRYLSIDPPSVCPRL